MATVASNVLQCRRDVYLQHYITFLHSQQLSLRSKNGKNSSRRDWKKTLIVSQILNDTDYSYLSEEENEVHSACPSNERTTSSSRMLSNVDDETITTTMRKVSELDYILSMLLQMKKVDKETIQTLRERFQEWNFGEVEGKDDNVEEDDGILDIFDDSDRSASKISTTKKKNMSIRKKLQLEEYRRRLIKKGRRNSRSSRMTSQ